MSNGLTADGPLEGRVNVTSFEEFQVYRQRRRNTPAALGRRTTVDAAPEPHRAQGDEQKTAATVGNERAVGSAEPERGGGRSNHP